MELPTPPSARQPAEVLLIEDRYGMAYGCLSRGLSLEESGDVARAVDCYGLARQLLAQGSGVPADGPRHRGPQWERARELQRRMRRALAAVDAHLAAPRADGGRLLLADLVPAAGQAPAPLPPLPARTAPAAVDAPRMPPEEPISTLRLAAPSVEPTPHVGQLPPLPARKAPPPAAAASQPPVYSPRPAEGHLSLTGGPQEWGAAERGSELISIPWGVQMFFVAPGGQVSALSEPGYLRVVKFPSQTPDGKGPVFLDVCGWLHPLTENTAVLLANSGVYMLPDTLAPTPDAFIGVVLSSRLPAADRDAFRDLLKQLADFRVQSSDTPEVVDLTETVHLGPGAGDGALLPTWSEKMGQGIVTGAARMGHGVARGAEATSRAIQKGAGKIRERLTPEETPSEVSPRVTKGLEVAKDATGSALRVSQYLVDAVSAMAEQLTEKVAHRVKKHGAKMVPESMKSKDGEVSNLQGVKFVASNSLLGFTAVWSSLEAGAKLIGRSVTTQTVDTVAYKYGDDAGRATDTALGSVTNVGVTAYNVDKLGIKAILKATGMEMAKGVIKSSKGPPAEAMAAAAADKGDHGTPAGARAAGEEVPRDEGKKKIS
ncbi:spartin-like [Stigmatopora argus]